MKNFRVSIDAIKQKAWKNKKWLAYILFTILLTVCLLYYRFPSDSFRYYLQATAERMNPKYLLSVEKVSPIFPPGFSLRKTKLSLKINPDAGLFMADSIVIRPEIWSFLKGRSGYRFNCLAYGGGLKGSVHFSGNSVKAPFSASVKFKDIRIDNYAAFSSMIRRDIKGITGGTIKYSGECDSLIDGTGEAEFTISDGRVELLKPILSYDTINFDTILMKIALKNQKIDVIHVELKWQDVKGSLSGYIALKKDILKSRLSLRGAIEIPVGTLKGSKEAVNTIKFLRTRSKKGKLNFIVDGTFISPTFRFI
ncbi:MAG: type II secretion system protein GspN [Candidatus Auribacterota bacterium]|nr:type II secretion system protein GspN [Candidatus Auribacterota bacterium]